MAGGASNIRKRETSHKYNGKITAFVVLSCMVAAMGCVVFGYDVGISGGVTSTEPFLEKFFPDVNRKMQATTANLIASC